jgi:hypothetical protein
VQLLPIGCLAHADRFLAAHEAPHLPFPELVWPNLADDPASAPPAHYSNPLLAPLPLEFRQRWNASGSCVVVSAEEKISSTKLACFDLVRTATSFFSPHVFLTLRSGGNSDSACERHEVQLRCVSRQGFRSLKILFSSLPQILATGSWHSLQRARNYVCYAIWAMHLSSSRMRFIRTRTW